MTARKRAYVDPCPPELRPLLDAVIAELVRRLLAEARGETPPLAKPGKRKAPADYGPPEIRREGDKVYIALRDNSPAAQARRRTLLARRTLAPDVEHFERLPDSAEVRLTVVQALYSCSPATVWRRVKAGKIPAPIRRDGVASWSVGELRAAKAAEVAARLPEPSPPSSSPPRSARARR